jgi:hypothetical protein
MKTQRSGGATKALSLNREFVIENFSFVIRKDGSENFAKNEQFSGIAPRRAQRRRREF